MDSARSCFDFHLHTQWSYDASAPVEFYFAEAARLGMTHIAITEHHQMAILRLFAERCNLRPIP